MSPRPKSTTDAEIFAATHRAVSRLGPGRLTLAEVAAEAKVSPATLVQRFGSKRGLLLAFVAHASSAVGNPFDVIRATYRSPLDAVRHGLADCMASLAPSPDVLANNLAFLQIDLVDPDFHKLALTHAKATRLEIKKLLDDAVKAGELQRCDTARLAAAVAALLNGSLLQWAIDREGRVVDRLRDDLDTLLRPRGTKGRKK